MSVIQEDEAQQYPDLYRFETDCIDFVRSMQRMRDNEPGWRPRDAIRPAKDMLAFLQRSLEALENLAEAE